MLDKILNPIEHDLPQAPVELDATRIARLAAALDRLPPKDRDIFLAAARREASHSEIARRHRISVASVRRIVARTLVRLHDAVWPEKKPRTVADALAAAFYAAFRRR